MHLILIFTLHCQLYFTYFRYYDICNIKITSQCKILIVPEEVWFGQPKYSTPTKNHSTLCRLLYLFSSLYTWSRLDHCWSNVHLRDHRSGCLLKRFIIAVFYLIETRIFTFLQTFRWQQFDDSRCGFLKGNNKPNKIVSVIQTFVPLINRNIRTQSNETTTSQGKWMKPASSAGKCIMTNHIGRDYYCSCDWLNTSHKIISLLKIILFCRYFLIILFFCCCLALQPKTTCIHFQTVYSRTWSIWRCCKFFFFFKDSSVSIFFFC